jgi:hypothetical protein
MELERLARPSTRCDTSTGQTEYVDVQQLSVCRLAAWWGSYSLSSITVS